VLETGQDEPMSTSSNIMPRRNSKMLLIDDLDNETEETKSMAIPRASRVSEIAIKNLNANTGKRKKQSQRILLTPEEELNKDYNILTNPQSISDVLVVERNIKLSNHIVVCGFHSSMYHFILPLRAKYLMNY
jgi:hypothetical protein